MKSKTIPRICAFALGLALTTQCVAAETDPGLAVLDTAIVRPVCLAATIVGSAFFVISLPWSIPSKSVHRAANALVKKPADATFKRPLGDMDSLMEY